MNTPRPPIPKLDLDLRQALRHQMTRATYEALQVEQLHAQRRNGHLILYAPNNQICQWLQSDRGQKLVNRAARWVVYGEKKFEVEIKCTH